MCRWVKTANGQAFADSIGVAQPPLSVEESAKGVLAQVRVVLFPTYRSKLLRCCRSTAQPKPRLRDLSSRTMGVSFHGRERRIELGLSKVRRGNQAEKIRRLKSLRSIDNMLSVAEQQKRYID